MQDKNCFALKDCRRWSLPHKFGEFIQTPPEQRLSNFESPFSAEPSSINWISSSAKSFASAGIRRVAIVYVERSPLGSDGNGKRYFHRSSRLALSLNFSLVFVFYRIRWNPPHTETHVFIHIPPVVLRCVLRSVEYLYHINFPINFNDDESVSGVSLNVNAKASGYKTQRSPENRNSKRNSRFARRYFLSQSDR